MSYIDTPSQEVELNSQPFKCVLLLVSWSQIVEWGRQEQQLYSGETRNHQLRQARPVTPVGGHADGMHSDMMC